VIACPQCRTVQPAAVANTGRLHGCPGCGAQLRVDLFNAFYQTPAVGVTGETVGVQGEAECFYHPGKKAVVPCAGCGRLLCALCDVEFDGRHLCLNCLQAGRDKKKFAVLENERPLYDSIALALAFYPLLFLFPTLITAPAAVYVALRYWKRATSLLPRTRVRYILALLLAGMQIAGWTLLFAHMIG
jgi:hypothetical protein